MDLICWQAVIAFSSGPTAEFKYSHWATAGNTQPARAWTLTLLKSLFFSQEYISAPETHRSVRHFENKKITLLWIWLSHIVNFCFLIPVLFLISFISDDGPKNFGGWLKWGWKMTNQTTGLANTSSIFSHCCSVYHFPVAPSAVPLRMHRIPFTYLYIW